MVRFYGDFRFFSVDFIRDFTLQEILGVTTVCMVNFFLDFFCRGGDSGRFDELFLNFEFFDFFFFFSAPEEAREVGKFHFLEWIETLRFECVVFGELAIKFGFTIEYFGVEVGEKWCFDVFRVRRFRKH